MLVVEDELPLPRSDCPSSGLLLQMEDIQATSQVLERYLTVYNKPKFWTGYELKNGEAVVPNSNASTNLQVTTSAGACSNCCIAWQLEPFELVAVDCEETLPAICTTSVDCEHYKI